MEPVILIIAVTAIISSAIVRYKKLDLEKEKIKYLSPVSADTAEVAMLRKEVEALKSQISNLELIVTDNQYAQLPATQTSTLIDTIEKLNRRIIEMERNNVKKAE